MTFARLPMLVLAAALAAQPVLAAPERYLLDRERSVVGFAWYFGDTEINGTMPIAAADLMIDVANPERSRVTVSGDVTGARAGFAFATQAMKGPKVLDAGRFPAVRFTSTRIRPAGEGARIEGNLTVRGVTRPVTFDVALYRQRGTAPSDLSRLSVVVSGSVSRSAFGADGWPEFAGDEVRFTFLARMTRAE